MENSAKALARRLGLIAILFALALLRAERGVAELKGTAGEPSRILRLAPEPRGDGWDLAFLGREARVSSRLVLIDGDGPLIPAEAIAAAASAAEAWGRRAIRAVEELGQ
ncbi:MAG TPA: hypothetical protein VD969_08690 [Symbiobacteriaceae bacterium]|nr:hypothetical protein [Symbiobacteriaceae bacterium]